MPEKIEPSAQFVVSLGHHRVVVEAATPQQAIGQARRRLADDLPRMWDEIYRLHDQAFRCELLRDRAA